MPRLPDRVLARMQPSSTVGAKLGRTELTDTTVTEARAVATRAVDAVASAEALSVLATRLRGEPIARPLSSLADLPSGKRFLDGTLKLSAQSAAVDVKVLQRALMKIGAHHPQGRTEPALMLLPYGADGSLGQGTLRAVDAALRLAGRADLTPAANRQPLGRDVAQAIEGLLRATPNVELPPQQDVFPTSPAIPQRLNLMGRVALPVSSTAFDARWKGVLARIDTEKSKYHPGAAGLSPAANAWITELQTVRGKPELFQLNRVNTIVNETPYLSDTTDTWKTPLEFFAQRGDCEDFAIAKMVSLKLLGFDESRMRLLAVHDTISGQAHAVLAVDLPDATYILDNQSQLVLKHEDIKVSGQFVYQPLVALTREKSYLYGIQR